MICLKIFMSTLLLLSICSCGSFKFSPMTSDDEEQKTVCTMDALSTCKQIGPGIYLEETFGREGPECKFPDVDRGDISLCRETVDLIDLTNAAREYDGKTVAVQGSFHSLQSDADCAETDPFTGEPTLSETYEPDVSGYGVTGEGISMKAELDPNDARTDDATYFSSIPVDGIVTLHGTFKYRTIVPQCGNGSVIHPSGAVVLEM